MSQCYANNYRYPANVRLSDAGEGQLRWCGGMLYVRARGAATPRVAPHRPGPASTTARSWDADLQRTQLHCSIVSYSIPATLGSRDEEMVSGRGWSRLLGLERWNKTTILVETVRSFTARAVAGQESRAAQEAASQAAPPPPPPAATTHPHWAQ